MVEYSIMKKWKLFISYLIFTGILFVSCATKHPETVQLTDAEPVYVEEFDLLLCMPEDVEDYPHPHQQTTFDNNLLIGLEQISESLDNAPMFKILANDPTNNFDQIFTLVNNRVSKVPVTHMDGDDFELVLITVVNGRLQKEIINLNKFVTGEENVGKGLSCNGGRIVAYRHLSKKYCD